MYIYEHGCRYMCLSYTYTWLKVRDEKLPEGLVASHMSN